MLNGMGLSRVGLLMGLTMMIGALGCSNTEPVASTAAGESAQTIANEMATAQDQLERTMSSLRAIMVSEDAALQQSYQAYSSSLSSLEETLNQLDEAADRLQDERDEYMAQWDRQTASMRYDDVRETSEQRREEVRQQLTDASRNYEELRSDMRPLMVHFRDIETALGNDLSPAGLDSMQGTVQEALDKASTIHAEMDDVIDEYEDVSTRLASGIE